MSEGEERVTKRVPIQLDYHADSAALPKYKFSRILPLSGSQTVPVPVNSQAEVLIEIPTVVFNFAKSYLTANIAIPPQGANTYSWIFNDTVGFISQIDLYTRSGIYLCQLNQFNKYMKIVRKMFTKSGEYEEADASGFLFPSNSTANSVPALTPNNGPAAVNYLESAYVSPSGAYGAGANQQIDLTMNLPLSAIKKTIFALDKDIVFPDIIIMRLMLGPASGFYYQSGSPIDPSAGTPALPVAAACVAPAPTLTAGMVVYNLQLLLATEKQEDLAQACRALVNSKGGLNILIDFPYPFKNSMTGGSQNISLRFNRGHGKNLLGVVSSPFNSVESLNTAYDCFNVADASSAVQTATGAKIANYYSSLDQVRLQDLTLICGNQYQDDYRENKRFMKDTPYFNSIVYNNNWFHYDQFFEPREDKRPDTNVDHGLSLIVERKYDFYAQMANPQSNPSYNWYSFAFCQKDLHIGSQMIQFQ